MRQNQSDDQLQTEDLLGDHRTTRDDAHETTRHDTDDLDTRDDVERVDTVDRDGGVDGADRADVTDVHRTHPDEDPLATPDETWDGAPAHDPGPAVDQDTAHGYADTAVDGVDTDTAVSEIRDEPVTGAPAPSDAEEPGAQLFTDDEVERFRSQWQAIQTTFVDDPQDAVRGADHLVAEVMQALAATFTEHKHGLEEQWQSGTEAQTEDLRQALRRYRSFFNQLLHT